MLLIKSISPALMFQLSLYNSIKIWSNSSKLWEYPALWEGILASCMDARIDTLSFSFPVICRFKLELTTAFWLLPTVIPRDILPKVLSPSNGLNWFLLVLSCSAYNLLILLLLLTIALVSTIK